jgi:hypothetical protein
MTLKPITKALMAYGVITLLALGMALLHIGGLFPGLLLMGVVMGAVNLASLLNSDDEEPPCNPRSTAGVQ